MTECITITFGDVAENHVRMQSIGKMRERGFTINELKEAKKKFEAKGCVCELVDLGDEKDCEEASILIVRNGVQALLGDNLTVSNFFEEQKNCKWDTKAYMFGRVCNKKARYNVCYGDKSQEPDYENKKGRIISFDKVPYMKEIRKAIPIFLGSLAEDLLAEGNRYYDTSTCYIGWHGDAERKIVVALRLGADFPLHFNWFQRSKVVGDRITFNLSHGDLYAFSQKATGNDWRKRKILTLRHAAGSEKNTKFTKKQLGK